MSSNLNIPTLTNPVGLDTVFTELSDLMLDNLPWLDNAFRHALRIEDERDGRPYVYPGIYADTREARDYINMLPDEHLGNYYFIDLDDGLTYSAPRQSLEKQQGRISLVFFFDFRDIYSDHTNKTLENVLNEVVQVLKKPLNLSRITINRIFREADNIYRRYSHNAIKTQFLKRPYGSFRIECDIIANYNCPQKSVSPSCQFENLPYYASEQDAIAIGGLWQDEFFALSEANEFGLPKGVIIQVNPSVGYMDDQAAQLSGVALDECFAVAAVNNLGLPSGTMKIIPSATSVFQSDQQAARNGVPVGGVYAVQILNQFGLIKGVLKTREV